jgi:adenylosuccinate lyase
MVGAQQTPALVAELRVFAEQSKLGGGILHLGATSTDIEDNADALRLRSALDLLLESLTGLLRTLSRLIEAWADTPLIAFTHLQPAEPSTLGYRLASYAQDLLSDYEILRELRTSVRGKGFKGAVGTGAGFAELIGGQQLPGFEARLSEKLDLPFFEIATQVYPRKQDYQVVSALAGIGASLYKLAFDLRILQSPLVGELGEPFGENQVGSSAMPFKRNPIRAEKIDSLARYLASLPRLAWDNAAHSLLERTLDDSANRRILLPEACLATDEILRTSNSILSRLRVDETAMARNLTVYGPFAATERLLMALVKAGGDRQEFHERLRTLAMQAWDTVQSGGENPLPGLLVRDSHILKYLSKKAILERMDVRSHLGDAPRRARALAMSIQESLQH